MTIRNNKPFSIPPIVRNIAIALIVALIAIPVIFGIGGQFVYLFETVQPGEVGLQLQGGQVGDGGQLAQVVSEGHAKALNGADETVTIT